LQYGLRFAVLRSVRQGSTGWRAGRAIGGRPSVVNPDVVRAARDMLPNPETSITTIARLLGVSPGTLYNHIPDLRSTIWRLALVSLTAPRIVRGPDPSRKLTNYRY